MIVNEASRECSRDQGIGQMMSQIRIAIQEFSVSIGHGHIRVNESKAS